ncbi:hypothetical protein V1264_008666 [Littorina saxatilis]|uniref:Uncharacterized protein n=2 Tax=Littorina saxatilis TaxID=31220 RepID=A0AAN9G2J7_9CAEN
MNETQEAFSQEFNGLEGYKTLQVLEFRDADSKTKVVYPLFFTTDVTDATTVGVAERVLSLERKGQLEIGSQFYTFVGLTGVFSTLADTHTTNDAVDWCSSDKLNTCASDNECKDGGTNPRYSCDCKKGSVDVNGECVDEKVTQYDMYPYGDSASDNKMAYSDDDTQEVYIPTGFPVGDQLQYYAFIGINGLISFQQSNTGLTFRLRKQKPMFCPYLSDIDTFAAPRGGEVYYHLYESRKSNSTVFNKADKEIREFAQNNDYSAALILVVTWDQVAHHSSQNRQSEKVTFQAMLVSDGSKSYGMVYYKTGAMNWVYKDNTPIIIGISRGPSSKVDEQQISNTEQASSGLDRVQGNTGRRGMWVYEVGTAYSANQECETWYQQNLMDKDTILAASARLPRCPCTSVGRGNIWVNKRSITTASGTITCYRLRNSASAAFKPSNKECCFRQEGGSDVETLVEELPYAGGFLRYNPAIKELRPQYRKQDRNPHDVCCYQATSGYCEKYYELRPTGTCNPQADFAVSTSLGDPHVITLDSKDYTFNGWGEYTMVTLQTNGVDFTLQGRTDKTTTDNGTAINATVFTAFAAKEGAVSVSVELEPENKQTMIIFAADKDYTLQFQREAAMLVDEDTYSLQRQNDTLVVIFPSGISLSISVAVKLLDIAVSLPNQFKREPKGLLGNFNDNPDDDFMLANGTVLTNLTEREIFDDFGKTWAITDAESVFRYEPRKGPKDFRHPDFIPIFLGEESEADKQAAVKLCGVGNVACIYDFFATGSRTLAEATKKTKNIAAETEANLKNTAPKVQPNTTSIQAEQGQIISIQLNGSDAEDGSGVTYVEANSASGNYQLNRTSGAVKYTATSPNKSENLAFYVLDSRNVSSPVTTITILYCPNCSGHGNCDVTRPQTSLSSQNFAYGSCNCTIGWDGDDCEDDFDGCAQDPCIPGQDCTDVPAANHSITGVAYTCSACPTGYNLTGGKCGDVDECDLAVMNNCTQRCVNTEGSFLCACNSGSRLATDGKTCDDINECAEKSSNCSQICTNVVGGFNCSCEPGYYLEPSNNTCVQNPQAAATCETANCTQGCRVPDNASTPQCFCNPGYKLNTTDNTTCLNEDECKANICSQNCEDSVGSFTCSCYTGFRLDADGTSCAPCTGLQYGEECGEVCACNGHGTDCDPVKGCVCEAGWRGTGCETDVNECVESPDTCGDQGLQTCVNTQGSYRCDCLTGYSRDPTSSQCTDVDECAEESVLNSCTELQECKNTIGGFFCACRQGYEKKDGVNCTDTDECSNGAAKCQQECTNNGGSYACSCNLGFRLAVDRSSCEKAEDVCAASTLNCMHGCTLDGSDNPYCFCHAGYKLGSNQRTCLDIDECTEGAANCSDTCTNQAGSFLCSCPAGKRLRNDQRTCTQCEAGTFGLNCGQACQCGVGADRCDPQTGCTCKSGWLGTNCDQDIDECATVQVQSNCTAQNARCDNFPGGYRCVCSPGFQKNESASGVCEDIDECASSPCGQRCENSEGSYRCLCEAGFSLNSSTNQCEDINECALSSTNDCTQRCVNAQGNYRCVCNAGFSLENDGFTCKVNAECSSHGSCDTTANGGCVVDSDSGNNTCYCNTGYTFTSDSDSTCKLEERNWCGEAGCQQNCANITEAPYFNCSCDTGYQLNDDKRTCKACPPDRWGEACSEQCTCSLQYSAQCLKNNGSCVCKSGWEGENCTQNINECNDQALYNCSSDSQCKDTEGSYICVCDKGFRKAADGSCTECDDWFFNNCEKACTCEKLNAQSCNKQNGTCTCTSGWEGVDCDTDINECNSTSHHNCSGGHETCRNNDGGFTCVCEAGYEYKANGTCGDRDECLDKSDNCPEECANNDGGFTCTCRPGSYGDGYTCPECPDNKFGTNCSSDCTCGATGTASCDKVNGTCYCKPGWTGLNCTDDVDECTRDPCPVHSTCNNTDGSHECTCNAGFEKTGDGNCTDIDECVSLHPCSDMCNNTQGSFVCSCHPGYALNGTQCQDVDECTAGTSGCDQVCNNTDGGFTCNCTDGYLPAANNRTCDKLKSYNFGLVINVTITNLTVILANNASGEYKNLKNNVKDELFAELKKTIIGLLEVIIKSMRAGSLITDAEAVVNTAKEEDSDASAALAFVGLKKAELNISNQLVQVSKLTFNGVLVSDDPCDIYNTCNTSASSCAINSTDNRPYCRQIEEEADTDYKLIIGLGVGIPLFFIAVVAIAFVVYVNVTGRRKELLQDDDRSMASGILATKIATRSPLWNPAKGLYSPDNLSSSSSEEGRQRGGMGSTSRPYHDTSLWSVSPRASPRATHGRSNFSWDFLFNQMPAADQPFSIKRPRVESAGNPTYDDAVRGASSS